MSVNSVQGLSPNQSLEVLYEGTAQAFAPKSVLERRDFQNAAIAITAGVVVAVAATALYLFVLIYYVIIPAKKKVPNPDYDPTYVAPKEVVRATGHGGSVSNVDYSKLNKTTIKDPRASERGIIGAAIGGVFLPFIVGVAVGSAVYKSLERARIQPLRRLKGDLEELYDAKDGSRDLPMNSRGDVATLMESIDDQARKELLGHMNFEQLEVAETTLGRKSFSKLLSEINNDASLKWKQIIQFGKLDAAQKLNALSPSGNQKFQDMVKVSPEVVPHLREELYAQNDFEIRRKLTQELDNLLGQVDENKITLHIGEEKLEVSKKWLETKSGMIREMFEDFETTEVDLTGKAIEPALLLESFKILRGESKLPKTLAELNLLAGAANYLQLDDLTLIIGGEVLSLARRKKISKTELLNFIGRNVPDDSKNCIHLREQALKVANVKKITSMKELTDLWPIAEHFRGLRNVCEGYYKDLLKEPKLVRSLYEKALELDSKDLKKLCEDHVKAQNSEYKNHVSTLYNISECVPEDLNKCLNPQEVQ